MSGLNGRVEQAIAGEQQKAQEMHLMHQLLQKYCPSGAVIGIRKDPLTSRPMGAYMMMYMDLDLVDIQIMASHLMAVQVGQVIESMKPKISSS